jgi:hypothetical protein
MVSHFSEVGKSIIALERYPAPFTTHRRQQNDRRWSPVVSGPAAVMSLLSRCWPSVTALAKRLFFDGEIHSEDVFEVLGLSRDPDRRVFEVAGAAGPAPQGSFPVTVLGRAAPGDEHPAPPPLTTRTTVRGDYTVTTFSVRHR